MAIDPAKNVSLSTGVNQTQSSKKFQSNNTGALSIGQELTKGAKANKKSKQLPETPGEKTGGVVFAEGTLKNFEVKEERVKDYRGVFKTSTTYVATLNDGTVVKYPEQKPIEYKDGSEPPKIKRNKDGSIDFIGLQDAKIIDTPKNDKYNLIGCSGIVSADNYKNDKDVIDGAFLEVAPHAGNFQGNHIFIHYNKGDAVFEPSQHSLPPKVKEYDGSIDGYQTRNEENVSFGHSYEELYLENGRERRIDKLDGDIKNTAVYSHDGKKLKESYVNATEKVLEDGYKIKTSPDGKEQWFYTPDGKAISKKEFQNRGLE